MKRYGMVIQVRPEGLAEYKRLHASPWPEVDQILFNKGIRNFSIFERDYTLFGYFEFFQRLWFVEHRLGLAEIPEFFQLISGACRGEHGVDDDAVQIDQGPVALLQALRGQRPHFGFQGFINHRAGECGNMAAGCAGADLRRD